MSAYNQAILGVPTNIITGFLGVGKTSAILHLIANKPSNEHWAVLVNEFGEIGVDGSLVEGQQGEDQQVFIREVAGGCMCCAAGVPMQVALNQLLLKAKPDRLLIEPTGLGHPKEVLQVLSSEHYRKVLSLQKNITLVDARNLSDSRYTEHNTFNQQIAIADIVVGNKVDLYEEGDSEKLKDYVAEVSGENTKVLLTEQGAISYSDIEGATIMQARGLHEHQHHHAHNKMLASEAPMPESGILKAVNEGEGFYSIGWRFSPDKIFDHQKLISLFDGLKVERMKAVLMTDNGIFGYNFTSDGLTETELNGYAEGRIEFISATLDENIEAKLLGCVKLF